MTSHLTLVVSNDPCVEVTAAGGQMSCAKMLDQHRLRAGFKDLWADYLKGRFRNVEAVATFFNIRFQTACNWWNGDNAPSGDKVALAVLTDPAGFLSFFGDEMARAA